jgi:ABC-type uncharacterized transport system permease subunit
VCYFCTTYWRNIWRTKCFFSFAALVVYGILLWGRHQHGWRGKQAIRWTIGGFLALMTAYFGTKFVLELLLQL